MNKFLCTLALVCSSTIANAGWFDTASESYLMKSRHIGNGIYTCTYKTNPGNRGLQYFDAQFQGGCPRFVLLNARTGQVTVPNQ